MNRKEDEVFCSQSKPALNIVSNKLKEKGKDKEKKKRVRDKDRRIGDIIESIENWRNLQIKECPDPKSGKNKKLSKNKAAAEVGMSFATLKTYHNLIK